MQTTLNHAYNDKIITKMTEESWNDDDYRDSVKVCQKGLYINLPPTS
jgi:hypothetical protein